SDVDLARFAVAGAFYYQIQPGSGAERVVVVAYLPHFLPNGLEFLDSQNLVANLEALRFGVAFRPDGGNEALVAYHLPPPAVLYLSGSGGWIKSGVRIVQIEDRLSDDAECLTERS